MAAVIVQNDINKLYTIINHNVKLRNYSRGNYIIWLFRYFAVFKSWQYLKQPNLSVFQMLTGFLVLVVELQNRWYIFEKAI
jgi:hypothetical protein